MAEKIMRQEKLFLKNPHIQPKALGGHLFPSEDLA